MPQTRAPQSSYPTERGGPAVGQFLKAIHARNRAIRECPGLTAHQKLLLRTINDYTDESGAGFPGVDTLAEDAGLGRATVFRLVAQLEGLGVLTVRHQRGRTHSNGYTVHLPAATCAAENVSQRDVSPTRKTSHPGPENVSSGPVKGLTMRPERTPERSKRTEGATPPPPPQGPPAPSQRAPDLHWDALVDVCGPPGTDSERGRYNKALKEIRKEGATPDDIRRRAGVARASWRVPLTPTGLAGNWGALGREQPTPPPRPGGGPERGVALDVQNRLRDELRATELAAGAGGQPGGRPASPPRPGPTPCGGRWRRWTPTPSPRA